MSLFIESTIVKVNEFILEVMRKQNLGFIIFFLLALVSVEK